ncbi:MAG: PAS domain S-box protein [Paludibacter sp.]|nr:PAS domain S-box protein [Paludibacter sp.]
MEKEKYNLPGQDDMNGNNATLIEKISALEQEVERLNALLTKSDDRLRNTIDENEKNQKLIEAIFNSVPGMIYLYDEKGRLVKWNKRFEQMSGLSEKDIRNRDMMDWFKNNPANQQSINLGLNKMALTGYGEAEATLIRKNGQTIPMLFTATPLFWDDKEYITGVGIDISTQKKAFELLTESEKKYRNLFNNTSNAFALQELIFDSENNVIDYRFLEVNPAFERITGLKASEIEGKTCREIMPDTEEYWYKLCAKVGMTGEPAQFENYSSVLKRYFQGTIYSNEYGRFATFFVDITDRKNMETLIKENEIKYRAIFNNSYESILIVDPKTGEIMDLNDTTLKMFGYEEKEDLLYSGIDHLSARKEEYSSEKNQQLLQKVLESNQVQTEWLSLRKDGTTFESEISLKKISVEGKEKVIYTVRDISRQRKAEESNRNNAQLLNDILQNSNSLIYIVDTKQRFITVNSKFASLFGKTPYELIGKTRFDFLPVHVAYEHNDNDALVIKNAKPMNLDEQYPESDGTHFYFTVKFPLFDKNQNIYGVAAISTDVTPTRLAVDALATSERKFQRLFDEHAAVKLLIDSETGMIADANKSAADYYGWSKEELCQMSISQINVLSIDEIKEQMQAVTESWRKSFIFKHRHKDGSISDVEVFSSKVNIDGKQYHHSIIMDITDKMVIENALKLSEERFSKAFRSSPDLILMTKFDTGQIVDVNDRVIEQTGYSYDEVIGRTTLELEYWYNPADREKFVQLLNEQGKVHNMETLLKLKSGELRHNMISAEVFELHGKKYILGVNRDITEKKNIEEQLRSQFSLVRIAGKNARLGGWKFRISDSQLSWSEVVCEIMGKPLHHQPTTAEAIDSVTPEHRDIVANAFQQCVNEGIAYDHEIQIINSEGKKVWVRNTGEAERNEQGEIIGVNGSFQDINERKIAEENYRKSREMFRLIFDQSPFGISLVNTKTGINIEANSKFAEITGRTRDELTGTSWMEITHPDDLEPEHVLMNELLDGKRDFFSMQKRYIRPDGNSVWIKMTVVLIKIDGMETGHHLCMIENINEQIKAEEALRESEINFRTLFEKGPIGIAYHKMIYDENDNPLDYLFLEANSSYKELTGVNPVGMKASEAFPGIENDPSNWIGTFGNVAKTGQEIRFQQHLEANDRWYDCVAYQYKPDHFVAAFLEITQQKRAEIALVESQKLYHSFVEHIPGAVFRKDVAGRYIFVNELFCKTKRLKPEEIVGKTAIELYNYEKTKERKAVKTVDFFQETLPEGDEHHKHIIRTGETIEVEEVYVLPDGSKKYFQVVKSPVFGFQNRVTGSQGIQFEITERKIAENALIEKERQLQTMISNLPGFVYRCAYDRNWTMYYISDGCQTITGYKPEQLIGNHELAFNDLIHPDDQIRIHDEWANVVPHNRVFTEEYRIIDIHGNIRWVWEQGRPVKDNEKNEVYLEGFITDITDRKNAEEALALSEEKFRTLFSEMSDVVSINSLVYDEHGNVVNYRITDCNPAFCDLIRLAPENIIGKLATEVYGFKTIPYLDEFVKVANEGVLYEFNDSVTFPDKVFKLSIVSPIKGTFAILATDLTEISNYNRILQEKNNELESYVYITSHDLRSPLVNVQGFSSRLKKQTEAIDHIIHDHLPEDERERRLKEQITEKIPVTLDYIFNNVLKMERMLNGLLQISRTGRNSMNIQPVKMGDLMLRIVKSFDHQISEKQAIVHISDLPGCFGDENMLNQLFSNIIGNSLKYSHSERIPEISISGRSLGNRSEYCIADNGIGIPPQYIDKIFNVFFRVDFKSQQGEGIGLSVVKRIVEKHKGQLKVESDVNKGTKFFIELPNNSFEEQDNAQLRIDS